MRTALSIIASPIRNALIGMLMLTCLVLALSAPRISERWDEADEPVSIAVKGDRTYAPRCSTDALGAVIQIAEAGHAS